MFRLLFIIFHFFSAVDSYNPKFCVNCKYFFIKPDSFSQKEEFGLCKKYPTMEENPSNYLVTGKKDKEKEKEYYYCSTSRKSGRMCGPEGKDYIKKKQIKKSNDCECECECNL